MSIQFATEQARLKTISLMSDIIDPRSGAGVAADIGSQFFFFTKTGPANTDWELNIQQLTWQSVRDYGALGDGIADDSAAFAAAIAAASATCGVVYIPSGTYRLMSRLTLAAVSGFQFKGAGPRSVVAFGNTTLTDRQGVITLTGCNDVHISNLNFEPTASTGTGRSGQIAINGGCRSVKITNCRLTGTTGTLHGIVVEGDISNSQIWIEECDINGFSSTGVLFVDAMTGAWFRKNTVSGSNAGVSFGQIAAAQTINAVFTKDNFFDACENAVAASSSLINSIISDNLLNESGVSLTAVEKVILSRNSVIMAAPRATPVFDVDGSTYVIVARNTFACADLSSHAIRLTGCGNSTVRKNMGVVTGPSLNTIQLTNCTRMIQVTKNAFTVENSTANMIDFSLTTSPIAYQLLQVNGNLLYDASGTMRSFFECSLGSGNTMNGLQIVSNSGHGMAVGIRLNTVTSTIDPVNTLRDKNNFGAATEFIATGFPSTFTPRTGWNAGSVSANLIEGYSGTPQGVVTGRIGSIFVNKAGGKNLAYLKESGVGNTDWFPIGGKVFSLGVLTVGTVSTNQFINAGWADLPSAIEQPVAMARNCVMRAIKIRTVAGTDAETNTYAILVNGAVALTTTISNTFTGTTTVAGELRLLLGDLISIRVTKSAAVTLGQGALITMEMN